MPLISKRHGKTERIMSTTKRLGMGVTKEVEKGQAPYGCKCLHIKRHRYKFSMKTAIKNERISEHGWRMPDDW
jgi:hypothetical protein